jgi:glycerate dehydrogenase
MRIVILDSYTINPGDLSWESLEQLGEVVCYDRTSKDNDQEILERIGDADIVITNRIPISGDVLTRCQKLRLICVIDNGLEVVDTNIAKQRGITVLNVEADGAFSLAQTAIAMLLELCHRIQNHSDSVARGDWEHCEDFCYWLNSPVELYGKTIGIVGASKAGLICSDIALALGMDVLIYDEQQQTDINYVDIDVLMRNSDVILLIGKLSAGFKYLISSENIKKMKREVIVINSTAAEYINESDLAEQLNSGVIDEGDLDIV